MNKQVVLRLVAIAVVVLAPALLQAQTLTVRNTTTAPASATTNETSPTQTPPVTNQLSPNNGANAAVTTGLPTTNALENLLFQQNGMAVGGTPYLITNVSVATLTPTCAPYGVPPCVQLTPSSNVQSPDVKAANDYLAGRSTTKEVCLNGTMMTFNNVHYFVLANGLATEAASKIKLASSGAICACGVSGDRNKSTLGFVVRHLCEKKKK